MIIWPTRQASQNGCEGFSFIRKLLHKADFLKRSIKALVLITFLTAYDICSLAKILIIMDVN
jgi:hypothetical protein